jgi:hypothetical protein
VEQIVAVDNDDVRHAGIVFAEQYTAKIARLRQAR